MAIDWTSGMSQTFEYYKVDPTSWKDMQRIDTVISSSIRRDLSTETLGSASFDIAEEIGECYIRTYLSVIQNGESDRRPLGTYLVQTPSFGFDGRRAKHTLEAYTPLLELKENPPPFGYALTKGQNVMHYAGNLARDNCRAPVVKVSDDTKLYDDFISETDDTWLSFLTALMNNAGYRFDLDEMGRILFAKNIEAEKMQPVWTFTDDNSSILLPDVTVNRDLYNIPNKVEVIYTSASKYYQATATNTRRSSPTSTVNRGRTITYRDLKPGLPGNSTLPQIQEYAKSLLEQLSSLEYTVTFSHAYCPARVGDCVRLNYTRAGLNDIRAKIISQDISCTTGCTVNSTAVYTRKLWEYKL